MEQDVVSSPAATRLWRPAAQRRVRNAWASLVAEHKSWVSASAKGLSVANALVNALLSERYLPKQNLGALDEMINIREKARLKLHHQQEAYSGQLLDIYNELVEVVHRLTQASRSMRTYFKGPMNGPLVEFSGEQKLDGDAGDGGGVTIFSMVSLQSFERFAQELVEMFIAELNVKELLVSEMYSAVWPERDLKQYFHLNEITPGIINGTPVKADDTTHPCESIAPKVTSGNGLEKFENIVSGRDSSSQLSRENFQVYLTAWLAEVHIDKYRIRELQEFIAEEMAVPQRRTT